MPPAGSDENGGRAFERWLAVGVIVLTGVSIVAFLQHRRTPRVGGERVDDSNLLRLELGGRDGLRPDAGTQTPAPLPAPVDPAPDRAPDAPPETPPDSPEVERTTRSVIVRDGDTLGHIAQRELGSTRYAHEIQSLNGITNPRDLRAGDEILVPIRPASDD